MKIRRATPQDAHAIAELHVTTWQAAYRGLVPDEALDRLSVAQREAYWCEAIRLQTPEVHLAQAHDRVVGWVAFGPCRDEGAPPTGGELWALYVAASHWSQGIGRALWLCARTRLAEQGFLNVSLWVLAENQRAIRFYRLAGFLPEASGHKEVWIGGKPLEEVRYVAPLGSGHTP